ncbi:hypothetical protein KO500_11620 [Cellulophaga baltica]|uniref:hypothetical protein n=1 Tax=Cellulophaga TaxID=104264 RepID=UPI001C06676B|nr:MULTISPECIES: hypothetical protein [Cellulophaga]MBU2997087.1 hypothetical protein [Cellulophaga baltica]MDO6768485.1 hypothetical protein [Cellulophaga sp. 1_MG-2023]
MLYKKSSYFSYLFLREKGMTGFNSGNLDSIKDKTTHLKLRYVYEQSVKHRKASELNKPL